LKRLRDHPYDAGLLRPSNRSCHAPDLSRTHSSSDSPDFNATVDKGLNRILGSFHSSDDRIDQVQTCNYVGSNDREFRVVCDHDSFPRSLPENAIDGGFLLVKVG
jgi:hypothetical protein